MTKTEEPEYENINVTKIVPGDVVSMNTGYRPLDDEDVTITKSYATKSLFGDDMWMLEGSSYRGYSDLMCLPTDMVSKKICPTKK
jgi:hypothetical protein